MLYQSSSHKTNGSFYRSASAKMLHASKPWVHGMKSDFSNGFDGSGMFRDTRISSLLKQRERQKLEAETRRKRTVQKEQFVARQLAMLEEKRQKRQDRRDRRKQRYLRRCAAATKLQGRGRIIIARRRTNERRAVRDGKLVMRIQRLVRRVNECRSSKLLLQQLRRKKAAIMIQSASRQRKARKRRAAFQQVRDEENARLFEIYRNERAVDIQRVLRGIEGRKRVAKMRKKRKRKSSGRGNRR